MIYQNKNNAHIFTFKSFVYSKNVGRVQSIPAPFPNHYENLYFANGLNNNIKHHRQFYNDVYEKLIE